MKHIFSGAIDGKHIVIQAPINSGSSFFNYKGTHSIVLLAVCDAHYRLVFGHITVHNHLIHRFILVDLGDAGRHSDGGILSNSEFGRALENDSLSLPEPCPPPGSMHNLPFVLLGDEAFPLKMNMMRPYPGRNLGGNFDTHMYMLAVIFVLFIRKRISF